MEIIKEYDPRKLFATRYGTLTFDLSMIELEFELPVMYKGRWKKGDSIGLQILSRSEIQALIRQFKIKEFPHEIFDEDTMKDIIDFIKG